MTTAERRRQLSTLAGLVDQLERGVGRIVDQLDNLDRLVAARWHQPTLDDPR